jgi:tyrosine-specific transport protein
MNSIKKGSVTGASLLLTGSCVGAGMLGLPILTGFAGFFPSMIMFILAWALMTSTALLLVEVGGWFPPSSNFPTMIGSLLGNFFKSVCFILYLSLFYCLLVAYIADSGIHFSSILYSFFDLNIKIWMGSLLFTLIFGALIYLGTKPVDILNRFLMLIKILSFFILIVMSITLIESKNLLYTDIKYTFFPLPILIISFGFHNMIPTITNYLSGDIKRVKKSIFIGSLFTLFIYLIWLLITLGSIPLSGEVSIKESYKMGFDGAKILSILYPSISTPASILAFSAILTSFLAQSMSVSHFLCDGLKINDKKKSPIGIILLTFFPPLIIAQTYPSIFYQALSFGGIIAVILFGLFPVMMAYKGRYIDKKKSSYQLFGGKITLIFLTIFSLFIILYRILHHIGLEIFPLP